MTGAHLTCSNVYGRRFGLGWDEWGFYLILSSFKTYHDMEAEYIQNLKSSWRDLGSNPGPLALQDRRTTQHHCYSKYIWSKYRSRIWCPRRTRRQKWDAISWSFTGDQLRIKNRGEKWASSECMQTRRNSSMEIFRIHVWNFESSFATLRPRWTTTFTLLDFLLETSKYMVILCIQVYLRCI